MDSQSPDELVELVSSELRAIEAGEEAKAALDRLTAKLAAEVGDMCVVLALDSESEVRVVSAGHADPEGEKLIRAIATIELTNSPVIAQVVKTGRSLLVAMTSARQLRSFMSGAMGPYLDRFGMSSLLLVPMRAEGSVIGCVALARVARRPPYDEAAESSAQRLADELVWALVASGLLSGTVKKGLSAPGAQRKAGFGTGFASFIRGDGPA